MSKTYRLTQLSLSIALCCAGSTAFAEITAANGNTQISQKQGVEIINIATPSAAGLSHNKYNKFNVDSGGAVLNNAQQSGKSQLAGDLAANPNLRTQSANVILNEVVSRTPSKIAGQQEIFGQKADYVLANPNGIQVENGGFINAPRASLVVGKPKVDAGKLNGYDVNNDNALQTRGKVTTSGDLDLIAPQVNIGGQISTEQGVNVITGRNQIARADNGTLTVTAVEKKGQVLDGKLVGSMQAGRIRIHSTDDRATITAQAADLNAKEIEVRAQNAQFKGKIERENEYSNGGVTHQRRGQKVREERRGYDESYQATRVTADKLDINVNGKLDINGANIQAKDAQLSGGNVHLGAEKTVSVREHNKNQSKGLWYRNEQDASRSETLHRSTIAGNNINIVAKSGKVSAEGAQIHAAQAGIYGKQGVTLQGAKAIETHSAQAQFKNETARLKTGQSQQNSQNQHYTATEITTQSNLVIGSDGDVNLLGAVAQVDGNLFAKTNGALNIKAEKTGETYNLNDAMRFWGGLAGSKTVGSGRNSETVLGADLTVKGNSLLDAKQGVNVAGSRVISGGEGVVKGRQGALNIDSVQAQNTEFGYARQGTIFDITKSRTGRFSHTTNAQGSTLTSQSNLHLSADKNVSIVGSQVTSAGLLDIAAKSGIEVKGATQHRFSESHNSGFSIGAGFDSLKTHLESGHLAGNLSVENSDGKPNVNADVSFNKAKAENSATAELNFHAGLNAHSYHESSQSSTHSAAQLSGGSVNLNAQNVAIAGSQVSATQGNLNVNAAHIQVTAQTNQSQQNSRKTDVNLGVSGTLTEKNITANAEFNVAHAQTSNSKTDAQSSQLSAAQDVVLNAQRIQHQGTQVQAGGNIAESAQQITHSTAQSSTNSNAKNVNVGLSVTASVDSAKAFSVETGLSAGGSRENGGTLNHSATQFQAGKNIVVNGTQIQDHATQYQAGEAAQLTSQNHQFSAESNRTFGDKLNAGANIGVSVSTADAQKFEVSGKAGANFAQSNSSESQAVQGAVNAKNVAIQTGTLNSQANIHGSQNVVINAAQSAQFSQADNRKSQTGGGFEAALEVGAVVVPAAQAALPTLSWSASANGQNAHSNQAVSSTISGGNVAITSQGRLNLQGTNVQAENAVTLAGQRVNAIAAQNNNHNTTGNAAVGINIGEKLSSVGANGKFGAYVEHSQTHNAVSVDGNSISISAQNGVNLQGVTSNAQGLNLNAGKGNLTLTATNDSVSKTDVFAGLNLGGGVAANAWTPSNGSGNVNVTVVRNESHTATALSAQNAQINAGGDAKFIGSTITAQNVSGAIGGNSHSEELANKVSEVSLALSANGSGKLAVPTVDKWVESAKNDWNNGTIAGVKAEIGGELSVKKEQTVAAAGINATSNQVNVAGTTTFNPTGSAYSRNMYFKGLASSQFKKQLMNKVPNNVQQIGKPITGVNVQLINNNAWNPKLTVKR